MIDPTAEKTMSLADAAKLDVLPTWRGGKPPTVQTLIRWCTHGYRGTKLEHVRFAGTLCTSREALLRFAERCTMPHLAATDATPSDKRNSHARANAVLDAAGL